MPDESKIMVIPINTTGIEEQLNDALVYGHEKVTITTQELNALYSAYKNLNWSQKRRA